MEPAVRQVRLAPGEDALSYIDIGSGPPLLFLHGALGDLRTWRRHCELLAPRFRCVAVTQRYFGGHSWGSAQPPFGVATHAADLTAFIDALGLSPANVVAWSYAGHVALHAAQRRPELFRHLVLFDPGVRSLPLAAADDALVAADARAMFGPIFAAVESDRPEEAARLLIEASGQPGSFDQLPMERRAIYFENAHTMRLLLGQDPPPALTCEELKDFPVSVDVLWGEHSRPAVRIPARAMARCIGGGQHEEIAGVGHLWPEEGPEAFCRMIAERLPRA